MNSGSSRNHLTSAGKGLSGRPIFATVLMVIMLCALFVAEFAEVFFFAFLKPFPKPAIVATHLFLLAVFIHYLIVNLRYRSQIEIVARRQSEQKAILNNIPDIAWLKDQESRFIMVNEACANSAGFSPDDLVGKSDLDLWPRDLAERYRADDRAVMASRNRKIIEEPLVDSDGTQIWIETIKTPIFDGAGEVIGTTGIARDISARKRIETAIRESDAFNREILNSLDFNVAVLAQDGRIIMVNREWERFARENDGAPEKTGLGVNYLEVCKEEAPEAYLGLQAVLNGTQEHFGLEYPCHSPHEQRWFIMRVAQLGAERGGLIVAHINITARKQAEQELVQALHSLGERVKELSLLYFFTQNIYDTQRPLPEILQELTLHIPTAWQYPEITAARLVYGDLEFTTDNFLPTKWLQKVEWTGGTGQVGIIEVYYLKEMPECAEGPFLLEERSLINSLASVLRLGIDKRDADRELQFHSEIMANTREALYLVKAEDLRIVYANNIFENMFGYEHDEMIGKHVSIVNAPTQKSPEETAQEIVASITRDGFWRGEIKNIKKDGTPFWSYATVSVFEHSMFGRVYLSIHTDITRRKQAEEAVLEYTDRLEEKVRERTEKLEEKTIEAEAANLAKSEFLANMSHELKTPLNAIVGFSELLKIGAAGELTATQNEYVQEVWESGRHLNRIINSILSMVQLESHQAELELSEFPLKETIEEILDRFSEKAAREGIRTTIEIPDEIGRIVADQAKLQEVVKQLLANAIKFTPEGGAIVIRAQRVAEAALGGGRPERPNAYPSLTPHHSGNFLEISVADTGIGIAEQDLGRLFKPFQQLDPTLTKTYEGIGLGLCLCRKYVELHGGKIWVESEVGKGSTFYLAIPELARLPQP